MKWQDFDYGTWVKENDKFDHESFDKLLKDELADSSSFDDLIKFSDKLIQHGRPPFKPSVHFVEEGNLLYITLSEDESYDRWLCPGIVVSLSFETNEITAIKIEGLSHQAGIEGILKFLLPDKKQENGDSE